MAVQINGTTGITTPKLDALDLELGSKNVVERGSNANGEYVRFADGTQICSCFTEGVVSDPGGQVIWFPASFATSPFPISMLQHRDSFSSAGLLMGGVAAAYCTIFKYSDTASSNPGATEFPRYYIRTIVVGRWF